MSLLPIRAVSEQFQSSFRPILEQFQSNFRTILEQFQSNFRAVSEAFIQSSFTANLHWFKWIWCKSEHFSISFRAVSGHFPSSWGLNFNLECNRLAAIYDVDNLERTMDACKTATAAPTTPTPTPTSTSTCSRCGNDASRRCSRCRQRRYCSKSIPPNPLNQNNGHSDQLKFRSN